MKQNLPLSIKEILLSHANAVIKLEKSVSFTQELTFSNVALKIDEATYRKVFKEENHKVNMKKITRLYKKYMFSNLKEMLECNLTPCSKKPVKKDVKSALSVEDIFVNNYSIVLDKDVGIVKAVPESVNDGQYFIVAQGKAYINFEKTYN